MTLAGWMIVTATGTPMWALTRPTRREAIAAFEDMTRTPWSRRTHGRTRGWRCVRVNVSSKRDASDPANTEPREPRADER